MLLPRPRDALTDAETGDVAALPLDPDRIACDSRLGGRLKHYYRREA